MLQTTASALDLMGLAFLKKKLSKEQSSEISKLCAYFPPNRYACLDKVCKCE